MGSGLVGGRRVHSEGEEGPRGVLKLMAVAMARILRLEDWVRVAWRVVLVAPVRRVVMVMVEASRVQGRRNSRWSLRMSGWGVWARWVVRAE